jgi:glycosyltransferase involved in cell wall biosynthesis
MPGLTCLHDFYLGNLFYGNYIIDRNHQHYFNVVKQLYGEATANDYFVPMTAIDRVERTFQSAPMTEWIASLSSGLITHSSWGLDRITKYFSGPTRVIPLSYLTPHIDIDSDLSVCDKIRILTVGHMNPNKRIDSIIEAISGSPHLKQHATLQLVGPISSDHSGKIKALADKLGVSISIHGSVDEDLLRRFFVDADISCCLRNPTLEAASASTIEAMQYGKAVIVLDHGFYKELPDDCVCKIPVDNEVTGLRNQLELLCKDQAYRKRLGEKAKNYAIHTFRPEQYARNIIEMCAQVPKASICRDRVNQATQYYITMLESWGAGNSVLSHQDVVIPMEFIQKASASSSLQLS